MQLKDFTEIVIAINVWDFGMKGKFWSVGQD